MSNEGTSGAESKRARRSEVVGELHALILEAADSIRDSDYTMAGQTAAIRDLALAFRYIDGGAQPGSGPGES